jgi:hypothetical protein
VPPLSTGSIARGDDSDESRALASLKVDAAAGARRRAPQLYRIGGSRSAVRWGILAFGAPMKQGTSFFKPLDERYEFRWWRILMSVDLPHALIQMPGVATYAKGVAKGVDQTRNDLPVFRE